LNDAVKGKIVRLDGYPVPAEEPLGPGQYELMISLIPPSALELRSCVTCMSAHAMHTVEKKNLVSEALLCDALRTPFGRYGGALSTVRPDGMAAVVLLVSDVEAKRRGLKRLARVVASATRGIEPRITGMGPVPAIRGALALSGLSLEQMDVIELNEAFAAQALAVLRELGLPDDTAHVNSNGGAIALGHPLGASGARLAGTAARQLQRCGGR
jgi:acetyl-CoA acetyltransferase